MAAQSALGTSWKCGPSWLSMRPIRPTLVSVARPTIANADVACRQKPFGRNLSCHDPRRCAMNGSKTGGKRRLFSRGFLSLLFAQFCGAANDNVLKQVLTFMVATGLWSGGLAAGGLPEGGQAVPALCLTLPFILLSGFAGQVADRYSKRTVMVWVKIAELPIALFAMLGFFLQNLCMTLGAMLLLAVQSSFFGPAKYGVVPEIVEPQDLPRANGTLNMFTNLAVIAGALVAGPVSVMYYPKPGNSLHLSEPILWAPGSLLLVVAVMGLVSILAMPRLPSSNPELKLRFELVATYRRAIKSMSPALLVATIAWSGFYMVGMIALLILPEYEQLLHIDYTATSLLIGALGVAIGVGSAAAGWLSGDKIRPNFIPVGAVGVTVTFALLGILTPTYAGVAMLIVMAGVFAGFYIVPLQALLRYLSPPDRRGQFLGTANAMSFVCSSIGAALFWLLTGPCTIPANRVHLACAILAAGGTTLGILQMKRVMPTASPPMIM